jgi:hypothetical protein
VSDRQQSNVSALQGQSVGFTGLLHGERMADHPRLDHSTTLSVTGEGMGISSPRTSCVF